MTYDDIFTAFYTQYRAEADIPASTDDEYTIGMRLANEAITRWANYDNTFWKELFTTTVSADEAATIVTGTTQYDAPDNFKAAGGSIRILDANNKVVQHYPLLNPEDVQFKGDNSTYAFFSGDPINGYALTLNPAPPSSLNGLTINYDYYKTPTLFETGTDVTEMSNPYFIVHRMLANRFRASRNPYYEDALRDAEDALRIMQMENNSGSWSNPWRVPDRSGTRWGD